VLFERIWQKRPPGPLRGSFPVASPAFHTPRATPDALTVTWVGHSTLLIQIGGLNVLTDPMWSERASPIAFMGPRRWMKPAVAFSALPPIDVVLLSHNHYDHFDVTTLRHLAVDHPDASWIVPLGLAEIVGRCGASKVVELDWWQESRIGDLAIGCAPAQHFSGRGFRDRDRTLWCSYALRSEGVAFYFGADSGLHPEYRSIGERFGPFDIVALPIGAYEPRWFMRPVHMDPDDAVQAWQVLASAHSGSPPPLLPIHWGTFKLTDEPMDEPPRLARAAWDQRGLPASLFWLMKHGETRERVR
jgi:N-acyl-phosphatidylethanolamine-hydrolysing phospholipase D